MKRTKWFERQFPSIADNGLFPGILERLEGTPARLNGKFEKSQVNALVRPEEGWSLHKEIGHLLDLEPLWFARAKQIMEGEQDLIPADLSNKKTHETDHDGRSAQDLISGFAAERAKLVALMRSASATALENAARHPRLGTPMKLIDLAFFVAEHDDHHLASMTELLQQPS